MNARTNTAIVAAFAIASIALTTPQKAAAEEAYSVEDVVAHFAESIDLGATRGLCIGTASECGEVEAAPKPTPLDLRVQFRLNSAELLPEARQKLDVFAQAAQDRRLARASFYIDGHTDALGRDDTNQSLSERRAASVVRYLVDRGVSREKLIARGYGESKPFTDDSYDPRNRRVEASLAGVQ